MPNEILVRKTNTGFFELLINGESIGVYGNPAKAMNVAMELIGYYEEVQEIA